MAASSSPSRSPMRSSPVRTLTTYLAVKGSQRFSELGERRRPWRRSPVAASIAAKASATSAQRRGAARVRVIRAQRQHLGHGLAQVRGAVVRLAERSGGRTGHVAHGGRDRGPAESDGSLVRLRERAPRQEGGGDAQLVGRQWRQVAREQRGLLRGASRSGDTFGQLAPATHGGDGIPSIREVRSTAPLRSAQANRRLRWPPRLSAKPGVPRRFRAGSSSCAAIARRTCEPSCAGTRTRKSPA